MKISEHFSENEFRCKCHAKGFIGSGFCGGISKADPELIEVLEKIRANYNGKVVVKSGYRCKEYNKICKGAPESKHCEGIAADIQVFNDMNVMVSPRAVAEYLDDEYPDKYGIGKYPYWVHIDVRKNRARWAQ